jgi:hypothetical protein
LQILFSKKADFTGFFDGQKIPHFLQKPTFSKKKEEFGSRIDCKAKLSYLALVTIIA